MKHTRRVVIVSWHFPPSDEIGGKIVWRLARHLAMSGCDVRVLAPPITEVSQRDEAYATVHPPGLRVIRTAIRPDLTKAALRFWKRMSPASPPVASANAPAASAAPASKSRHPLRSMAAWLQAFSDHRNRWIAPAARRLRQMLADEPADLVLSVAPAFPAHLVAMRAHRTLRGTRWFAWFHDPGAHFALARGHAEFYPGVALWAARRLAKKERRVIENASRLLVTTQHLADEYAQLLPHLRAPLVVPCGFDGDEFPVPTAQSNRTRLVVAHVGTIYWKRTPRPVVESLARLRAAGVFRSGELHMQFVGRLENAEGKQLMSLIEELDMGDVVTFVPQVSQADALKIIQRADVGLVLAEHQPPQVPAKLFEYIGLRRPVLALSDGATYELVTQCRIGYACQRQGLDDAFAELISQWRSDGLAKFQPALEQAAARYDMAAIARNLLQTLESGIRDDEPAAH